jgi:hypothetical protein
MSSVALQSKVLCLCLIFCTLCAGERAFADSGSTAATTPTKEQAMQRVREELENLERRWYGIARFRYSYPQQLSAGFGAMFVVQPKDSDCSSTCMVQGWQFEIEPGRYGIQGSVGWGKLVGETGRTEHLMYDVHLGWAVRGVVLRTYGDFRYKPLPKTLAGVEGSFTFASLNFSLGILRSLQSGTGDDWLISAGVGFGF